jgi:hypothetical protein
MSSTDTVFAITITNIPLSIAVGDCDAHRRLFIGAKGSLANKYVLLAQACFFRPFRSGNVAHPSACPFEYQHGQDFEASLGVG